MRLTNIVNGVKMYIIYLRYNNVTFRKIMKIRRKNRLSTFQLLSLGYLIVILIGSALLSLPIATKSGQGVPYIDALLTATSATCVTGLTPYDPSMTWSLFGQIVMLILIQIGGIGFMTFVTVIFKMIGRNLAITSKKTLMLSTGESTFGGIGKLIKRIVIGTLVFETLGACVLMIRCIPTFGAGQGIYYSIWHSVSAFCNAGFDLLGGVSGAFGSLSYFAGDTLVLITIAVLIIIGGLGFCVWGDMFDCRFRYKKFQLNTKVMLITTAIMIIIPTLLFLLFERNSASMAGMSFGERLLNSFFCAISPRTAGFSVVDYGKMSDSGYLLTIILMFVGGGSGSTAGGIKIGTFAVIIMGIVATIRKRRDIVIGKRRLDHSVVSQALSVTASCLFLVAFATLIMCAIEPDTAVPFKSALFECFSALGTVGLSMPVLSAGGAVVTTTSILSIASKLIIIFLMYLGRVGILTLAMSFGEKRDTSEIKKPLDNILIG